MATPLYWDPLNGNDANDGTSYANRKKTLSALTAISTGGVIRGIDSPTYQLTNNATWTNGSPTVTLGASVTQMISDCETAWTASANVTSTASTTAPREGTKVSQNVIAAAFTTGLCSYFATGTLDLSGYQQVSFWFKTSVACAASDFSIKLCTDTAGVTAAHTINVPAVVALNNWVEVTVDTGGALNSAIKSVALYQNVDFAATVSIDNVLACKASSSVDALTLHSMIGKNTAGEPQWWNIKSINGVTIVLDPGTTQTTNQNYYGTTETVTTYRMEPYDYAILAASSTTALESLPASGSVSAPILISGGWTAASSMASQSGYTGLCGRGGGGFGIGMNSKVNVNFENFVFSRIFDGLRLNVSSPSVSNTITNCQSVACADVGFYAASTANAQVSVVDCYTQSCPFGVYSLNPTVLVTRGIYTGCASGAIGGVSARLVATGATLANSANAFYTAQGLSIEFYNGTITNCTNLTRNAIVGAAPITLDNTVISSVTNIVPNASSLYGNEVHIRNYNATAGDHRIYTESSTTIFDTSTYPTGGQGGSWKLSPTTTNRTAYYPIIVPIKPGPLLRANQPVTINGMYKRDHTNITASVVVKGGYLNGISTDQTATLSAAAGTWATFSITVTPTVTGFPQIELQCYDGTGTTNSAWFYLLPPG